jgi:hypothetical protein
MVDRAKNIFHHSSHTPNESRSTSRSKGGGDPYGLNALGGFTIGCCGAALAAAAAAAAMTAAMIVVASLFYSENIKNECDVDPLVLRQGEDALHACKCVV